MYSRVLWVCKSNFRESGMMYMCFSANALARVYAACRCIPGRRDYRYSGVNDEANYFENELRVSC